MSLAAGSGRDRPGRLLGRTKPTGAARRLGATKPTGTGRRFGRNEAIGDRSRLGGTKPTAPGRLLAERSQQRRAGGLPNEANRAGPTAWPNEANRDRSTAWRNEANRHSSTARRNEANGDRSTARPRANRDGRRLGRTKPTGPGRLLGRTRPTATATARPNEANRAGYAAESAERSNRHGRRFGRTKPTGTVDGFGGTKPTGTGRQFGRTKPTGPADARPNEANRDRSTARRNEANRDQPQAAHAMIDAPHVMAGLVPGLSRPSTPLICLAIQNVDARDNPRIKSGDGHDEFEHMTVGITSSANAPSCALRESGGGLQGNAARIVPEKPAWVGWRAQPGIGHGDLLHLFNARLAVGLVPGEAFGRIIHRRIGKCSAPGCRRPRLPWRRPPPCTAARHDKHHPARRRASAPLVDRLAIEHRPLGDLGRGLHDLAKLAIVAVEGGDELVAIARHKRRVTGPFACGALVTR